MIHSNNSNMPKISIVIPVFNAEKFLVETLDSVRDQTFTDFECVIVNDESTDKSLDIINSYVQSDQRFKAFTIPNSGCANIPIQFGIRHTDSDLIMIIGHDDVLENTCLRLQYQKLIETNSDIVILTLIGCISGLEGELYRLPLDSFDKQQVLSGYQACSLTIGRWQISCNGMLFKKELYNNIPVGNYMNSDELSSRYILYNAQRVSFSEARYIYRNHNNSISRNFSPRLFERLLVDKQLEDFVCENYSVDTIVSKSLRNTRLFNMIYLQYDFLKYKNNFTKEKQIEIANNFREVYNSQNLVLLRKELPLFLSLLFASNYTIFKISSIIYVSIKDRNGRKYLMK